MNAFSLAAAPEFAGVYDEYQGWPSEVRDGVARYFLSSAKAPERCLILGCATGVNDALPLARLAGPAVRIVAGDVEPAYLERLRERTASEGLTNIEARVLDVTKDLSSLGTFDLVSLLFVIHRLAAWEGVIDQVAARVAPGGCFYISEFVGPRGIIHLSNEAGGPARDSVAQMIRRYFELCPDRFAPTLKSSAIAPVRDRLATRFRQEGYRDFGWKQTLTPGEMFRRIRDRAYAPYFGTRTAPGVLERLRAEFAGVWSEIVDQTEVIRIYRFRRPD